VSEHPRVLLDEVIHSPVRLSIIASLARIGEIDFAALREIVDVSDSLLSKHLRQLEERGYVRVRKGSVARRARTWLTLTDDGSTAFRHYRAVLAEILDPSAAAPTTPSEQVAPQPSR